MQRTEYFQRTMNDLLRPCSAFSQVYINDIVIHSSSVEEHDEYLRIVLQQLRRETLYAKRKKCTIGAQETEFCGFLVNAVGILSQPEKTDTIEKWPTPQSVKDVRAFLGLEGFYQRFSSQFNIIAAPLTRMLK